MTWSPPVSAPLVHYAVVRKDLPLGVLCAQLLHAAGESAKLAELPPGTHAVVLAVESQADLLELEAVLIAAGVQHVAVREPWAPWDNDLMAIGFPPQARENLTKFLRHLPLLR